jgi:predicted hydrolase (HD superfamily)
MKTREESRQLMREYISNEALINHCEMVAKAMEAYANKLALSAEEIEEWWAAGLLHDLDWEKYPDEHPNKAVSEILPPYEYSTVVLEAIKAHAPDRTGKQAETLIEKYLFACDELSGFLFAAKLIRPNGWEGMEVSSIKKKLKDKRFAATVSREDITKGAELIEIPLEEHIQFLIEVFS